MSGKEDHPTTESGAEFWRLKYEETRREFEEFEQSSRELEQELEKQVENGEQTESILKADLGRLRDENRFLKEQDQRNARRIEALEEQLKISEMQKSTLAQYKRELEQKNDELEISYRNSTASVSDHTKKIEALIEEKALLENELEQSRGKKEAEQRLRDELRDLRDELSARNKADEARQAAHRERRRTIDQNFLQSDNEITRLQAIASGTGAGGDGSSSGAPTNRTVNGHENGDYLHKACREREAELTVALANHQNSKSVMQNLVRKISALEGKLLGVQSNPVRHTSNGQK